MRFCSIVGGSEARGLDWTELADNAACRKDQQVSALEERQPGEDEEGAFRCMCTATQPGQDREGMGAEESRVKSNRGWEPRRKASRTKSAGIRQSGWGGRTRRMPALKTHQLVSSAARWRGHCIVARDLPLHHISSKRWLAKGIQQECSKFNRIEGGTQAEGYRDWAELAGSGLIPARCNHSSSLERTLTSTNMSLLLLGDDVDTRHAGALARASRPFGSAGRARQEGGAGPGWRAACFARCVFNMYR